MADRVQTSDKLAEALMAAGAPADMVIRARAGYYDDYRSTIAAPCLQLVADADQHGLTDIGRRARNGEWDAQKWESDEWAASPEGRATLNSLPPGMRKSFDD